MEKGKVERFKHEANFSSGRMLLRYVASVQLTAHFKDLILGETAFMEKNYDTPDNDYVAEIVPRYGRAVIFDGNFPHSAHPPAPDYSGPRYTFVVKLSINKREAITKAFNEESPHSPAYAIGIMR